MIIPVFATAAVVILALAGAPLLPTADEDRRKVLIRLILALFAIASIWTLAGCASVEGNGFTNSGAYRGVKLCKETTRTGERWHNCKG